MSGTRLRVVSDVRCGRHRVPAGFPERPERLTTVLDALERAGMEVEAAGDHPQAAERVATLHSLAYVERFERAVAAGRSLLDTDDNPIMAATWEAAWAAVAASLHAADRVLDGAARRAFAAVRPPGHHAERGEAMGFCFFNNAALVAEHCLARGLGRVAILDFDVHHGNGTQHLFEERADVFYASLHQFPFYPGTGAANERGRGEGAGTTLNVPLPAGTGDAAYEAALEDEVLPQIEAFGPQLLVLSAGFDAYERDPLGGMRVTRAGFRRWGEMLGELADRVAEGRVVVVLEGGYALPDLGALVVKHLAALAGGS
ncbi:MAG: histone deacetylase family protein [Thermoanaerobaculia bacterium]